VDVNLEYFDHRLAILPQCVLNKALIDFLLHECSVREHNTQTEIRLHYFASTLQEEFAGQRPAMPKWHHVPTDEGGFFKITKKEKVFLCYRKRENSRMFPMRYLTSSAFTLSSGRFFRHCFEE